MTERNIIDKLLGILNIEFGAELIPTILEEYSKEKNCFFDVQRKVKLDGGKIHYGWILHKNEFFYEAERHAVWENDDEDLINITPTKEYLKNKILFVTDNNFKYEGQYIGNIRVNSTKNNVVDDYIFLLKKNDEIKSIFIKRDENDNNYPDDISDLIKKIELQANIYYTYIKIYNGNEQSKCICANSNKIYKNCHGKLMRDEIDILIKKSIKVYRK